MFAQEFLEGELYVTNSLVVPILASFPSQAC
jgi:hypothetical protein